MKALITTVFLPVLLLLSYCNNKTNQPGKLQPAANTSKENTEALQTTDTSVVLLAIDTSTYKGPQLTSALAKQVLYQYFEKKGYYNEDNLPAIEKLTDADSTKLSVAYDTIFTIPLNHTRYKDAIITYWLTAPYASGHCLQPHKAMIADIGKGYTITHEEFIPEKFFIDSVTTVQNLPTIFGYEYECANDKVVRKLRITIQQLKSGSMITPTSHFAFAAVSPMDYKP
jgi:hypothetical protein